MYGGAVTTRENREGFMTIEQTGSGALMNYQTYAWVMRNRRGTRRLIASLAIIGTCTGCTQMSHSGHSDILQIQGTPEAIRAYGDMQVGLITTGKASPDTDTAYHVTRRHREDSENERVHAKARQPGFIQKLFSWKQEEESAEVSK